VLQLIKMQLISLTFFPSEMHFVEIKLTRSIFGQGSAPDPAGEIYYAPSGSLVGWVGRCLSLLDAFVVLIWASWPPRKVSRISIMDWFMVTLVKCGVITKHTDIEGRYCVDEYRCFTCCRWTMRKVLARFLSCRNYRWYQTSLQSKRVSWQNGRRLNYLGSMT